MLPTHDTSDVPEARTMTVFLGYLFARLIESSSQIRAAIKIEKYFRLYRWRSARSQSAKIIQRKFASYVQRRKYVIMIEEWREYKSCCETTHSEDNCHDKSDNVGNINNNTDCNQVNKTMNENEMVEDEDEDDRNDDLWLTVDGSDYMCGHNVDDEQLYEEAERDRIIELLHRTTYQHSEQCPADVKAASAYSLVISYPDAPDSSTHSYPDASDSSTTSYSDAPDSSTPSCLNVAEYFDENSLVHTLQEGEEEEGVAEENKIFKNIRPSEVQEQVPEQKSRSLHDSRNANDKLRNRNDNEEHSVFVSITVSHMYHGQSPEELKTEIDKKPYGDATNCVDRSSRGFSKLQVRVKKL